MKFKELEIKEEGTWLKRSLSKPHTKKTLLYVALGMVAGLGIFYFTEGRSKEVMAFGDILRSMLVGGLFGFIITNSPCARNKC